MGKWEDVMKTLNEKGILNNWKVEFEQKGIQKLLDLLEKGISLTEAKKMVLAR